MDSGCPTIHRRGHRGGRGPSRLPPAGVRLNRPSFFTETPRSERLRFSRTAPRTRLFREIVRTFVCVVTRGKNRYDQSLRSAAFRAAAGRGFAGVSGHRVPRCRGTAGVSDAGWFPAAAGTVVRRVGWFPRPAVPERAAVSGAGACSGSGRADPVPEFGAVGAGHYGQPLPRPPHRRVHHRFGDARSHPRARYGQRVSVRGRAGGAGRGCPFHSRWRNADHLCRRLERILRLPSAGRVRRRLLPPGRTMGQRGDRLHRHRQLHAAFRLAGRRRIRG